VEYLPISLNFLSLIGSQVPFKHIVFPSGGPRNSQ